jgi:hypothetical protein
MLEKPDSNGYVSKNFSINGGYTKEGRLVVVLEWPDEQDGHVFDRDEALAVGLCLIDVASQLYSSRDEFGEAINWARKLYQHRKPLAFQPPKADTPDKRAGL